MCSFRFEHLNIRCVDLNTTTRLDNCHRSVCRILKQSVFASPSGSTMESQTTACFLFFSISMYVHRGVRIRQKQVFHRSSICYIHIRSMYCFSLLCSVGFPSFNVCKSNGVLISDTQFGMIFYYKTNFRVDCLSQNIVYLPSVLTNLHYSKAILQSLSNNSDTAGLRV